MSLVTSLFLKHNDHFYYLDFLYILNFILLSALIDTDELNATRF